MINQLTQKLNGHCNFPQPKMTSSDCSTYLTNGQNPDNLSYKTVSAGPHSLSLWSFLLYYSVFISRVCSVAVELQMLLSPQNIWNRFMFDMYA